MRNEASTGELTLGGRPVYDVGDRIRRYCGLPWSGGPPETWAYRYYDLVRTPHDDVVEPTDVLAAAALHPGLQRSDLAFFHDQAGAFTDWLRLVPSNVALADADDSVCDDIARLARFDGQVTVTLLTKVLHRKRPRLIPLLDRHVIDWYRPITGERTASRALGPVVRALRDDLANDRNRLALAIYAAEPRREHGIEPSALRLADIALWMGGRP